MGVRAFFGKLFKSGVVQAIAPAILETFAPGIAPVIEFALRNLLSAEDKLGAKTGPEKLQHVMEQTVIAAPLVIKMIENTTGRELADEDLFHEAMTDLTNAMVKLLNAFRMLPKVA